jgi:hypothetical protein
MKKMTRLNLRQVNGRAARKKKNERKREITNVLAQGFLKCSFMKKETRQRWADQKERDGIAQRGWLDGWQRAAQHCILHVRAQTPHWRCGQKCRKGRAYREK